MSEGQVRRVPIISLDDPQYAHLARRIAFPVSDRQRGSQFFPAFAGFNVGSDGDVDVSFLYSFRGEPSSGFDRHLHTEEMFVPLDGGLCLPLAACKDLEDPDERPTPEDFVCAVVPRGEALILRPNVWHNGGWPVDAENGVRYIMVLFGHRAGSSHQGRVDHIVQRFDGGVMIVPDWNSGT